ncbi:MAG: YihY/virulence factor BrkB family protein [Pirellulales bacterium]
MLLKTFGEFASDNCMRMAAALSYYAIFSLPAIMAIVVSIAGTFFGADEVRQRFLNEARDVVGQNGAEQLETMIEHANRDDRGMFGTIGSVAILVFAATGVMSQLQSALNDAWDVRPTTDKSKVVYFFVKRAISLLMIAGIALVLSVSIVASAVLTAFAGPDQRDVAGARLARGHLVGQRPVGPVTADGVVCFDVSISARHGGSLARRLARCRLDRRAVHGGPLAARHVPFAQQPGDRLRCRRLAGADHGVGLLLRHHLPLGAEFTQV